MYEFAVVVVDASVVVSESLGFRRRRLVTYHSKHALKPTATIAVRDTDNPATAARDSSFSASTVTVPLLLEQTLVQTFHKLTLFHGCHSGLATRLRSYRKHT